MCWHERNIIAALAVVLAGCSPDRQAAAPSAAGGLSPLTVDGSVLRDALGREVILRGLNHIALRSNGTRPAFRVDGEQTPYEVLLDLQVVQEEDFDRIASLGYNLLRPVFTWEFVQPDPPPAPYNEAYFRLIDAFLDKAAARGIYVVFNFGQCGWSRAAGGNAGAPDWAISDTCMNLPGPTGSLPPQLSVRVGCAALDFWENEEVQGVGLQDAYIELWREVVHRYRDHPAVVMVDLLNEPYGGLIPPVVLETAYLYPFYRRLAAAIREIDPGIIIGFQPELYHSLGIPTPATQAIGIENAIYLPHNYTVAYFTQRVNPAYLPAQDLITRSDFSLTAVDAAVFGTPWLLGETGWTRTTVADGVSGPIDASDPTAPPKYGRSLVQLSNEMKIGWTWFAYSSIDEAYGIFVDGQLDAPLMREIATPFPRAVGGTIESIHFDPDTREFALLVREPKSAAAEIALPMQWQYPDGACVSVDGVAVAQITPDGQVHGEAVRFDAARSTLTLQRTPAAITIRVPQPDC